MKTTVRLIREVNVPSRNGPTNGQYALQKALRAVAPAWLKIGGELQDGEIPWFWCWLDRDRTAHFAREKRPFVMGPNMLFMNWTMGCAARGEREVCDAASCLLQYTESKWYRELIARHCGPENSAPIVLWPYPIDPQPAGPLPVKYDLLIYAKSGYRRRLLNRLADRWPRSRLLRYGQHRREQLAGEARVSRACVYLSDNDRGPLGLAEILLTGCPAVGIPRGAPWIVNDLTGCQVDELNATQLLPAIEQAQTLERDSVRAAALEQFSTDQSVKTILSSLREAVANISDGLDTTPCQ